jgi:hypothetical protein
MFYTFEVRGGGWRRRGLADFYSLIRNSTRSEFTDNPVFIAMSPPRNGYYRVVVLAGFAFGRGSVLVS